MHKTTLLLTLGLLFMTSCNEDSKTVHALFIDATRSTVIMDSDNPERILENVKNMWLNEIKPEETLYIYPIHARTTSATDIGTWTKPKGSGGLNEKWELQAATEKMLLEVKKVLFEDSTFPSAVRNHTDIFSVFKKVKRLNNNGKVQLTIISDMIEDTPSLNFSSLFKRIDKAAVRQLAVKKYHEEKDEILISGLNIRILYPGTYAGTSPVYTKILNKVNIFWDTFFTEAGAKVLMMDLS